MSGGAVALALGAAVLHAGWNVLLAGSRDTAASTAGVLIFGVALLAVPAVLTGGVSSEAVPFIAGSAVLELAYFVLLARAYDGGECQRHLSDRSWVGPGRGPGFRRACIE